MEPKEKPKPLSSVRPGSPGDERILAVDCQQFLGPGGPLQMEGVTHIGFADLTAAVLWSIQPTLVVLPLIAAPHDAITIIEALQGFGYVGRVTVLAPSLPNPGLVERELRGLGPGARLTLISP